MGQRTLWRGGLLALALTASCGKPTQERAKGAASAPAQAPTGAQAVAPSAAPSIAAAPAPAAEKDVLGGLLPLPKAGIGEPPELAAIKERIVHGDRSTRALKEVQKLSYKYPKSAEIAYILGQLYCDKLWMTDGMEAFRRALRLEPALRTNPYLIRAVVNGLGNDSDHIKVRRFLVQEIGKPAIPFLEEMSQGNYRQQIKERATNILSEIK